MEQLRNCMSESISSSALEDTMSWQNDVFSKVKGSDKKGRIHCLGKVPTSKKSIPSTSTNNNVEQRLSEVKNILGGLVLLLRERFPNENVTDMLRVANQLATGNRLDRELPDANSGQCFSRNNLSSTHSSHHQNERNEGNDHSNN